MTITPDAIRAGVLAYRRTVRARSDEGIVTEIFRAMAAPLIERIAELERTFDLRWEADLRAVARWRAGGPGRDLILPDHADLCVWLLDELESRGADRGARRSTIMTRHVTPEERDRILAMRTSGMRYSDIAAATARSVGGLQKILRDAGYLTRGELAAGRAERLVRRTDVMRGVRYEDDPASLAEPTTYFIRPSR